jgi:hypothetical protein
MFINMNLSNTAEPKPVVPGRYQLTIADAKYREAKGDIQVSIGIDGHDEAPNISHFMSLPKADDDAQKSNFKQLMVKRFLTQFGIPYSDTEGFEVTDFAGSTATAQLTLSEPDDSGAVYNRLNLDKLPNEAAGGEVRASRKQ